MADQQQLYCTGCFGPINGPICWVNGMPYHSQTNHSAKKGFSRSSLCAPPTGTPPPPPPPIPGQIDLDGQIVT